MPGIARGGPNIAHGGQTASALDEALGHLPLMLGEMAVTAQLSVNFIKPIPIERPLQTQAGPRRRSTSIHIRRTHARFLQCGIGPGVRSLRSTELFRTLQ
ncbi:hotdog domain-containing protein [Nocardia sp. NPDC052278]|uniref:hotdog domain-containing protein n=1 Tax=unclassified Nocardia TaxID=2637762 RepID=UPI003687DBBA